MKPIANCSHVFQTMPSFQCIIGFGTSKGMKIEIEIDS